MGTGTMDKFVENNGEMQFANSQSSRDLRASSEPGTQLMEAIDTPATFFASSRFQRER
jgi:hypothetical protein